MNHTKFYFWRNHSKSPYGTGGQAILTESEQAILIHPNI